MSSKNKLKTFILLLFVLSGCVGKNNEVKDKEEKSEEIEKLEGDIKYTLYSTIEVNNKQPYVFLVNAEENNIYMQFKVYESDNLLWSSKLVEPGKGETLNVYKLLESGEYELKYLVTSYSLEDKSIVKKDVCINQKIQINKEGN